MNCRRCTYLGAYFLSALFLIYTSYNYKYRLFILVFQIKKFSFYFLL